MKRLVAVLMLIGMVILLIRYLIETEEGALADAGQRTARIVREKMPGASEQAARGIEALANAAESGARTGRRLAHSGRPSDGADIAATSSTPAEDSSEA